MTSLEDELQIPSEATLNCGNSDDEWILETNATKDRILISMKTSIRNNNNSNNDNPRCLVIGRQAKVADIRIQHGSISRKHAALYYLPSSTTRSCYDLILQDFGSKKGTYVNGNLVKGTITLQKNDEIIFGNVRENTFRVHHCSTSSRETVEEGKTSATTTTTTTTSATTTNIPETESIQPIPGAGLTGRAKREAEIAAMMESLEQTPTYKKFVPTLQEDNDDDNMNNIKQKVTISLQQQQQKKNKTVDNDMILLDEVTATAQKLKLPILERMTIEESNESNRNDGRKHMITCIGYDPSGARFMIGTTNNIIRLYDFAGMTKIRHDPFKMIQAEDEGGHVVIDICYSNTGDKIIVGTGSLQPFVLDRDGGEIIKFVRGDMYVVDQSKTSGHTAAITGVDWHPLERDIILTSSNDGSARIWNLNGKTQFQMLVCDKVFQPKTEKGKRTGVNCVAFHPGGREFAVGTSCGSIQIWNTLRVSGRPERAVYDAHGPGNPVNSIVYTVDGSRLASRCVDDRNCKVWDHRRISRSATPVVVCAGVPTLYEHCRPAFSPNGWVLCVGTSQLVKTNDGRKGEKGGIKMFEIPKTSKKNAVDAVIGLDISFSAGVTVTRWHPKLNQLFLGCSDGKTEILFDPSFSKKGAMLPFTKAGRQTDGLSELLRSKAPTGSAGVRGQIIAPNALPIGHGRKRKRDKELEDPSKSRQPEAPGSGFKSGGTQSGATLNFTQFLSDSKIGAAKEIAGKDPREELLKYREGKSYISQAYAGNQEVILAEKTVEEEEAEQKSKK